MNFYGQLMASAAVALVAALYMLQMSPKSADEGIVELSQTQVVMIAQCPQVFTYVGDLSNYPRWFPGVDNMTAVEHTPMGTGKTFEETVTYPIYGGIVREVYVVDYSPPSVLQFMYNDLSQVVITLKLLQKQSDRCILDFSAGTKRTSYIYHIVVGIPLRIMYSLRGRHAMFAIRSMFNNPK